VDAMLATAVSRLLKAAAATRQMRELNRQDLNHAYWKQAVNMGEHLFVAGHTVNVANLILAAEQGIPLQADGGLVH
jgi:hypothetical protein